MTKTQSKLVEAIAFANKVIAIAKTLKKDAERYKADWIMSAAETLEEEAENTVKTINYHYTSRT